MLYKFKSKAAGDVIMLGPDGDRLLRCLGREPAARGILCVEDMPSALQALEAAVLAEEQLPVASDSDAAVARPAGPDEDAALSAPTRVSLRQRAWPLMDLIRHALAERQDVVWGV